MISKSLKANDITMLLILLDLSLSKYVIELVKNQKKIDAAFPYVYFQAKSPPNKLLP